jgi:hypothetical protein
VCRTYLENNSVTKCITSRNLFASRITGPECRRHTLSPSFENLRIRISCSCSRIFYPTSLKLWLSLIKGHVRKAYSTLGVYIHAFLTSALDEVVASRLGHLTSKERSPRAKSRSQCRSARCGGQIYLISLPWFEPRFHNHPERRSSCTDWTILTPV